MPQLCQSKVAMALLVGWDVDCRSSKKLKRYWNSYSHGSYRGYVKLQKSPKRAWLKATGEADLQTAWILNVLPNQHAHVQTTEHVHFTDQKFLNPGVLYSWGISPPHLPFKYRVLLSFLGWSQICDPHVSAFQTVGITGVYYLAMLSATFDLLFLTLSCANSGANHKKLV